MSYDSLVALAVFAWVTSITPGPSNFMLLASGANFGFRATVPQVLGITLGFTSLLLAVGLGLGALLTVFPVLHLGLKIGGGLYLLHLAWRIARSSASSDSKTTQGRPLTLLESAAFQWINPKAWVVALAAMAVYTSPASPYLSIALICLVFALVNLPTVSAWAAFGVALGGYLAKPVRLRRFNVTMGLLLAATLWPMLS
jgi:threonine/homoserine/homoserine lactone efflux protein